MTTSERGTPLTRLYDQAFRARHPIYASIELTYTCNLACYFCYNPVQRKAQNRVIPLSDRREEPLSFEEMVDVLDQLKDLGILYLTLTGGEPLLHPRFWEIAQAAKDRSFAMRIFSNGASITEAVADKLQALMPHCLEISIHGARDETAEALTQVKGSLQRQIRALAYLRDRGIRVFLKCVVTKLVEDQLEEIRALAERFDYPIYFDPVLTISDDRQLYPLELRASDEGIARLYRTSGLNIGNSPFEREPEDFNCSVGTGVLHITPYGDILPCVQWKQPVGNVRQARIRHIWDTSPLLLAAREANLRSVQAIRDTVEDHAYCAHCPGLSQLRTGDPLRPDEQYVRVAQIRSSIAKEAAGRS